MERFRLVTKNQLNPEQRQLFDLVLATGITIHPKIFKAARFTSANVSKLLTLAPLSIFCAAKELKVRFNSDKLGTSWRGYLFPTMNDDGLWDTYGLLSHVSVWNFVAFQQEFHSCHLSHDNLATLLRVFLQILMDLETDAYN
ncbi:hypothetical protein E2C01_007390 [Portunus trituberculatus]|uniref:Uncharacterized protein n=1 Tax=Portunus trituberculatus TaxID=210409 RepID=A0A5B7CY34_PORTR|nr:hypothetical protein [Portunus trituberculatus]